MYQKGKTRTEPENMKTKTKFENEQQSRGTDS